MLKVYGIDTEFFEQASYDEIVRETAKTGFVQLDCETYGFDPHHTSDLLCFQLGNYDNQYVIHPSKLLEFKDFLEKETLIGHNIKFDLKFLYKYGVYPRKVYDTFLAESVIFCGIKEHRKGLSHVASARLGVNLDKSVRDNIWNEGLTKRVIEYSGDDVKYLEAIKDSQKVDLDRLHLSRALKIENDFVRALAYIEFCGFRLDAEKWKVKMEKDKKDYIEAEKKVNQYIIDNNLTPFIKKQLDLFTEETKVDINWASPKQVIALFKYLKIPTSLIEEGETKDSVSAKNIERYATEFPFIKTYLEFKGCQKELSTYGQTFIDQINPMTGRVHTNFRQILDTGRLSSGGKNRETGEEYINFQNIPSDKDTRACFVASPGNTLLVSDYSGQEQIVLANFSLDENLLKFYDQGLSDMHSFVASIMESVPFEEMMGAKEKKENKIPLSDREKELLTYRQAAKIAGFAINYGGNGSTIAAQLGKTEEVGNQVYEGYFRAFPGLKDYFARVKAEGLEAGFIQINSHTYRKSFISGYETYRQLERELDFAFWTRWKKVKHWAMDNPVRLEMREKMSTYFKIKGAIERKSLNFPIQGTSAEITKISCIYFFNWILEKGWQMMNYNWNEAVLMVNTIHDENVVEVCLEKADETSASLKDAMIKAGQIYCKRVPLLAEPEQTIYWRK
jgi:DNA polymerase-1